MDTKKFVLAGLAGGVSMFLLGWLFYDKLFMNFFAQHAGSATGVASENPHYPMLFIANLCWGFLLSLIFNKWATISTPLSGAKAGALIGFLFVAGIDLMLLALTNLSTFTGTAVDIAISTVVFAITGAVVGIVSGKA